MRRAGVVGVAIFLVCVMATAAFAAFPQSAPNDPDYGNQTYLFDHLPAASPLATDPENSSGMWVDRAWRDYTTGRADTVIAYVEGGINWQDASAKDLVNKVYINHGELPTPCTAAPCTTHYGAPASSYDVNHDLVINIQDYAHDPRVTDRNGNGYLDPEDLIATFSDGIDHDHNGYVERHLGLGFLRPPERPRDRRRRVPTLRQPDAPSRRAGEQRFARRGRVPAVHDPAGEGGRGSARPH